MFRASLLTGGYVAYGDRFDAGEFMFELAAGYSRSLKAEDDTRGDGRDDLSFIRGLGAEVAVSVWRRESRRDFRMDGSAGAAEAKSTTEVV